MTSDMVGVAIVTGGGRGLGKAYALDLARNGARLVINDVDHVSAAAVATECHSLGADAVADDSPVGTAGAAQRLVARALDEFDGVDAIVCNAGVVRDRTVGKLSDSDIDVVLDVHLRGVFDLVRASWPHFRSSRHGRIGLVSSAAALFGNVGQANYAAAKGGVLGLGRTLAREGAPYGISVNVVAPLAKTEMAGELMPEVFDGLRTGDVAPVMTYLCSRDCEVSGQLFAVGGGLMVRVVLAESEGVRFDQDFTRDDVAAKITDVCDLSQARFPSGLHEHLARYPLMVNR